MAETEQLEAPGVMAAAEGVPGEQPEMPDDELAAAIRSLTRHFANQELAADRNHKVACWKHRMMERGYANCAYNASSGSFQIDGTAGVTMLGDSETVRRETIRRNYNIYLARERTWAAAFSQTPPGTRFEAVEPENNEDITAAQAADGMRRIIEKFNAPSKTATKAARLCWTDSRVIGYTRFVTDAQRFGLDRDGKPVGREVLDLYGVLETKVPLTCAGLHEYPYLKIETDHDVNTLKAQFPDVADKITVTPDGSGDQSYARMARISSAEGFQAGTGGDGASFLATLEQWWLRPSAYYAAGADTRNELLEQFPSGLYVAFVGDTLCDCRDECMDDHLEVMHAMEGDGQARPAIGDSMVDPQRVTNDLMSMAEEAFKYVIPMTLINEKLLDIDAIQDMDAGYGAFVPVEQPPNVPMAELIQQTATAQFPPEFMGFTEQLFGPISDALSSTPPVLAGGSMEDVKTARGYAMARDQALGVIGLTWKPFTEFYASLMAKTVRVAAACRKDQGKVSATIEERGLAGTRSETVSVRIADLEGNFACFPDTDANFPEGYTARSNKIMALVMNAGQNPATAPLLMQPDNQALIKQAIGIEELVIPGVEARNKQIEEIAAMEGEDPIINPAFTHWQQAQQIAAATGQPPQPSPPPPQFVSTIAIDVEFDDHQAELDECTRWLNSRAGQDAKKSQAGWFANVRLHALAHKQAIQQAAQSQAQMQVQLKQAEKAQPPKPPTETINFKDAAAANPAAGAAMLAQAGLPAAPPPAPAAAPPIQEGQ